MRDINATPIIRYSGPPDLRKGLEMEGRKFLGYVKGVMGGGLPYQRYVGRYNNGTTIEVQSMNHTGDVDVINIIVPSEEVFVEKKEVRRKRMIEDTQTTEVLVPIIDLGTVDPQEPGAADNAYLFWPGIKFGGFLYFSKGNGREPEHIYEGFKESANVQVELMDLEMQYLILDQGGGEPQ